MNTQYTAYCFETRIRDNRLVPVSVPVEMYKESRDLFAKVTNHRQAAEIRRLVEVEGKTGPAAVKAALANKDLDNVPSTKSVAKASSGKPDKAAILAHIATIDAKVSLKDVIAEIAEAFDITSANARYYVQRVAKRS